MDAGVLAALAGDAVVTAAATDAWEGFRRKVARLFGRGRPDPKTENRLDATRQQLTAADAAQAPAIRAKQAASWETRFADLLADHPDAAAELDALVRSVRPQVVSAAGHSVVAGHDVSVQAGSGGVAAGVIHGDVRTGPTSPGPAASS